MKKRHHVQSKFCHSRPSYREARWERAVKVYTINQESKYLLIQGIPSVGVTKELVELFAIYGEVEEYRILDEYPSEEFTDTYWIKFKRIQSSRFAKKKQDMRSFYGGILHVSYAPEFETINDTREKLRERRQQVERKCKEYYAKEDVTTKEDRRLDQEVTPGQCHIELEKTAIPEHTETESASKISSNEWTKSQCDSPTAQAAFPPLPLPPFNLPVYCYPPPPPPPPSDYPKIPTKHATLPSDLQTISRVNMERDSTKTTEERKNKELERNKSKYKEYEEHSISKESTGTRNIPNKNQHSSEKRIIWMKQPSASTSSTHMSTSSVSEPGAWDPFAQQRKQSKSLTGDENLDNVALRIRDKLRKVSTEKDDFSPREKKRPRKRI